MATALRSVQALRLVSTSRPSWRAGARRGFSARQSLPIKKYTENHEWIDFEEGGKTATIGISEFASKQLGDVVFVELPEIGLEVKQSDVVGSVESVKSASDIYAPVSGTITDTNPVLEDKPGSINQSPERDAWLAKMEVADPAQVEALMTKEEYDALEK